MPLDEYISADLPYSGLSKEQLLECAYQPAWVRVRKALLIAFWVSWFILLCSAISLIVLTPKCAAPPPIVWWQREPVYHLYVSSWQDGLYGDGVGDLPGIESKLDYIKDIGVGTIWLSPIYTSPMKDFGYDISNFTDISPVYGTMDDFRSLVKSMKEKDLKLVMDFVPNHSSDEHEWFVKSVQRIEPYSDYYVWVDPKGFNLEGEPLPPNNWRSVFGGSAWEWSEARQQFYLHQFLKEQPDLNYRNSRVLKEMKDVMQFWLDEGVDGFRMDAVAHLFEDERLRNEPIDDEDSDDEYQQLDHIYTFNLPETLDVLREFRVLLDQNSDQQTKIMMVEAYLPVEDLMPYYGNQSAPIAHFPFNFELISSIKSNITAQKVHDVINSWMNEMPVGAWPNWVAGNHDNSRVATRFGREHVDAMNMILLLLPGTPVIYYGDEIGMEDMDVPWELLQDTAGVNAGPDRYKLFSRDPERTPMQWNYAKNAGFSTANRTWLPINPNYIEVNVEAQRNVDNLSHLKIFQQLTEARKQEAIISGTLELRVFNKSVLAFSRVKEGTPGYLVITNFANEKSVVDLTILSHVPEESIVYTYSTTYENSFTSRQLIKNSKLQLPGKGGVVLIFIPEFPEGLIPV